ncbi:NUDIX domain-containing protein [Neolewinella lacunae]|uniref:NUDIX hydrolase n=1 Tax=Neolewinella lacunae TaxID=1517758 RepID=A0A923PLI8_9BACT|nr:NUDIX domain-containing protein [Neolewinella lacunae]MBC6995624.1 NUDIX hydrolase [Neolewinella lacunae]MDN3635660.1 NUDIX domain-containing protein [Neolewinella lacunae]
MYTYEYPRPSVTVDIVVFGYDGGKQLKMLLIRRGSEPFKGCWALPGGFVDMEEDLEQAAFRELEEETGVKDLYLEQLFTFGKPGRDPRGRVISVAYFSLVNLQDHPAVAASDVDKAEWFALDELPPLAFDHNDIIQVATSRLNAKVRYQPIGFELLPEEFTLGQLQQLYETVLNVEGFNKRNFRTRILRTGILEEVGRQKNVAHRPAVLYRFNQETYRQLAEQRDSGVLRRALDFEI